MVVILGSERSAGTWQGGRGGWNIWEEIDTKESAGSYARKNAETVSAEIGHSADVPSANLLREVLVGLEASKLWPGEVGVRCNNKNLFLPAIRATLAMHLRSSLFYIHTVVPHNSRFHALDAPPLPIPWVNVMAFHIAPGVTRQFPACSRFSSSFNRRCRPKRPKIAPSFPLHLHLHLHWLLWRHRTKSWCVSL